MKVGQNVSEQLSKLGIPQDVVVGQMARLNRSSLARLSRLGTGFNAMAAGQSQQGLRVNKFALTVNDARQDVPKPWSNLPPKRAMQMRAKHIAPTYYQNTVAMHPTASDPIPALFNRHRRKGAVMVQRLLNDDIMKKSFERGTQLNVVNDGRADGAVSVSAMTGSSEGSYSGVPGSPAQNFFDIFAQMDEAVLREAAKLGLGTTGSLGSIFGGTGNYGSATGDDATTIFGMNSSTTGSTAEGESQSSVDLMTFELKRLMDKRQQAYDLFRSVFDKHNEAAKQAINNMRA